MALYYYQKERQVKTKKLINFASYISLTLGALLLFWSFYPVVAFEIYSRLFLSSKIFSPVPKSQIASSLSQAGTILGSYNIFSNNLRDFTQANLWFPSISQTSFQSTSTIKEYALSIPKLNIKTAKVTVAGSDLAKSLVHFLPRSMPGEFGNVVIFGHSTLPQLYDPKDYKTIFTYLPSLEKGDQIYVKVNDVTYEYDVYDMFVVKPDQISVLDQQTDASYLTLITCVPPGTYWNRLVVKARLSKMPSFN